MNREITNLLSRYSHERSFSHFVPSKEKMEGVQTNLNLVLPNDYATFLEELGQGGFNGFYVFGFSRSGNPTFEEETLYLRKYGLPENLAVIENCDEWAYCIDCDTGKVVSWSQLDGVRPEYDSFDDYLLDRLHDAIENL